MKLFNRFLQRQHGWLKALPVGFLLLLLGRDAQAYMDTFYIGSGDVTKYWNSGLMVNYNSNINATNVVNNSGSTFDWTYPGGSSSWPSSLYHSFLGMKNFTNYNMMKSPTGFRFDLHYSSGGNTECSSFCNKKNFECGLNVGNNLEAGIYVVASNLFNGGKIHIGAGGHGMLAGRNVQFTNGPIEMDNNNLAFGSLTGFNGSGGFGLNTNAWNPGVWLQPDSAQSAFFTTAPNVLALANSAAYLSFNTNFATSNILVRAIFASNLNSNAVIENHYLSGALTDSLGFGGATVEWISAYQNPYDGSFVTNYLYLRNDFPASVATNIPPINGYPGNFQFTASSQPLATGLNLITNAGFPPGFSYPNQGISNRYSYADVKLNSTTVDAAATISGLTNIEGRIEITASNRLSLTVSRISGMNYLLLNSPRQFEYDHKPILAPYSDNYLGATNGNLTISNLYSSQLPAWNGSVQAWSTMFTNAGANGFTYDYRVMIVQSSISPYTVAQQQDLVLYSSNNVVISDAMNVFRKLSINATNLLLTTNLPGSGAYAFRGELNLNSSSMAWDSSLPNLRVLTNNGAIRTRSVATFGNPIVPYLEFVNTGVVTNDDGGTVVFANDFVSSGIINAGTGEFRLNDPTATITTATITNGILSAGANFTAYATSLVIGGNTVSVGDGMTIYATDLLTDLGLTNSFWTLGSSNAGAGHWPSLYLPIKPKAGDLLGTTITCYAVKGTTITHTWAGEDRGYSFTGYTNNAAIGKLILDAKGAQAETLIEFAGADATNAIYVDCLQLRNYASYTNRTDTNMLGYLFKTNLSVDANLVIYYAQALEDNGLSVAEKIDHWNDNHFRWMTNYAGNFSAQAFNYTNGVVGYANAALLASPWIDSDGDGVPNSVDPTPMGDNPPLPRPAAPLLAVSLTASGVTPGKGGSGAAGGSPAQSVRLEWAATPLATNTLYYSTDLSAWHVLTNFVLSSMPTNVVVFDPVNAAARRFYKVSVTPVP